MQVTIDNLKEATAQDVFDTVAKHLLTQNAKATTAGSCTYLDAHGNRCAAGCLIPMERLLPGLKYPSSLTWINSPWDDLVADGIVSDHHSYLIRQLQRVHDSTAPRTWVVGLRRLANMNRLNDEVLR